MTTATVADLDVLLFIARDNIVRHSRPNVFERAVLRLSVAMLRWVRDHAHRRFWTSDELALSNHNPLDREARDNEAIAMHHQRLI